MELDALKELEELRIEMGVLKEEYKGKCELSNRLRRVNDEQLAQLAEMKAEIERQSREISVKAEEALLSGKLYEEVKRSLTEKESALKNLGLANESARSSAREKIADLEGKNREFVAALEEANGKTEELERCVFGLKREIEVLKRSLLESEKKCLDAEAKARAPKEISRRDEMLLKIEEEKAEIENRLKWKVEQFRHLEEAHRRLQDEFRAEKRQWGAERSKMAEEMHSLQMSLDSQTRLAQEFDSQLKLCNQALAHEESRRKLLEVKISESRVLYDRVVSDYEDARLTIEALSTKRDEEIGSLRSLLTTKVATIKESEFRVAQLEQENQELLSSLKEHQEAQINGLDAASSLKLLRQKFKTLEQAHKCCPDKLKASVAETEDHLKKLRSELDDCFTELTFKEGQISELKAQIEGFESLLMQQKLINEELSIVLLVVEEKYFEACSVLDCLAENTEVDSTKLKEKIAYLTNQLGEKNHALEEAKVIAKKESDVLNALKTRITYLEPIELKYATAVKQVEEYKGLHEELSRKLDYIKQQASQNQNDLQNNLIKVSDALEHAKSALVEKTNQLRNVEVDLQQKTKEIDRLNMVKSQIEIQYVNDRKALIMELEFARSSKAEIEELVLKEKGHFHQIIEEKDRIIEDLKRHANILEEDNKEQKLKIAAVAQSETDKSTVMTKFFEVVADVDRKIEESKTTLHLLEHKFMSRCDEIILAFTPENSSIFQALHNQEEIVNYLQKNLLSLEQNFARKLEEFVTSYNAQRNFELENVRGTLEKMVGDEIVREQQIQFNDLLISEMHEDIGCLLLKLKSEEQSFLDLKNYIVQLESDMSKFRLETECRQLDICNLCETLLAANIFAEHEIQLRNMLIADMEEDMSSVILKLKVEEEVSRESSNHIERLKSELSECRRENEHLRVNLMADFESLQTAKNSLEDQLKKLKNKIEAQNIMSSKFSQEKGELVAEMMIFNDMIMKLILLDKEMKPLWGRVLEKVKDGHNAETLGRKNISGSNILATRDCISSPRTKEAEIACKRSPLKEQNF